MQEALTYVGPAPKVCCRRVLRHDRQSEDSYRPTTMYHDRAITPELFQWESQGTLREAAPAAQRYIDHVEQGSTVYLFLRRSKKDEGWGAPPYVPTSSTTPR
jgi:hypothetical protein